MTATRTRPAFTLVELLVVMGILGLLAALIMPAVQHSRESARRTQCKNNLKQMGLALQAYESSYRVLPPGCVMPAEPVLEPQAWGWAALLLPFLDQRGLNNLLDPDHRSLAGVLNDAARQSLTQARLEVFRCPTDNAEELAHDHRLLTGFPAGSSAGPPPGGTAVQHPIHGPINPGAGLFGIKAAASNYVGSFGSFWRPQGSGWTPRELAGNGVFGSIHCINSGEIRDGMSFTIAVGERPWSSYAGVWVGVDGWDRCDTQGLSMVLGTAYYELNLPPEPYHLSCDGKGSAGFGSMHDDGAMFLFADGSVHFISQQIDSRSASSGLGTLQRLAHRSDGQIVNGF